jgi:hypothetical protein
MTEDEAEVLFAQNEQLHSENEDLRNEIARLRVALKPFALEAEKWIEYVDSEPLIEGWPDYPGDSPTVGDCRRAREVMTP